ncbi:uncharacterized protein PHACADRAFT_250004 [Phanerochaete carnosa HHB-10118-sp]|uniref:Uncharacterized protein n=1 Tax=Phanerochaete carnosa (strain HHB-10118-sp) TaxID=650164 RepID=K5W6D5_PHACS|nr:uncharacterized protein PHACADRAFT_250004 [Phanerochaete carnosa HHB-10118-sp]EKM59483.1 hypothetical protein PHACADRAFT_250004 [Phanerochaete carnosa HHB-10118-sp]
MGERTGTQDTIRAKTMTARPSVRAPLVARKQSSKGGESSASEAIIQEDDKSAVKKRLVETKPRSRPGTVRPITTKVGENKVPPRKLPATASIPRGPVRAATTNKPALKLATASSRDSTNQPLGEKVVEKVVEEVPADIIDPIFA